MNESEFEQQLRRLAPGRPSHALEERIARELVANPAPRSGSLRVEGKSRLERWLPVLGWFSLGAAAAVVVMLSLHLAAGGTDERAHLDRDRTTQRQGPPQSTPVDGTNAQAGADRTVTGEVLAAEDEGLWDGGSSGVGRRVRYSSVERRSWTDASGAVTVVEVPREDVVVMPVSIQ